MGLNYFLIKKIKIKINKKYSKTIKNIAFIFAMFFVFIFIYLAFLQQVLNQLCPCHQS